MAQQALPFIVIGCGRMAERHLRAAAKVPDLELAGLVSSRPERAAKLAAAWRGRRPEQGTVATWSTAEAALEDPSLLARPQRLAVITSTSGSHYRYAKAALSAGWHLLLEKPMAMHAAEALELWQLAERSGRQIAMGHIYRYFPILEDIQKDLSSGMYGKPYYAQVSLRWGHDQSYYDHPGRGTAADDGGVLLNQSVHALDLAQWLLGDTLLPARAVDCAALPTLSGGGVRSRLAHRLELEDTALGALALPNGALLQLEASTCDRPQDREVSLYVLYEGCSLRASLRGKRPRWELRDRAGHSLKGRYNGPLWRHPLASLGRFLQPQRAIYEDLLAALRSARAPLADARAGMAGVCLVEALTDLSPWV